MVLECSASRSRAHCQIYVDICRSILRLSHLHVIINAVLRWCQTWHNILPRPAYLCRYTSSKTDQKPASARPPTIASSHCRHIGAAVCDSNAGGASIDLYSKMGSQGKAGKRTFPMPCSLCPQSLMQCTHSAAGVIFPHTGDTSLGGCWSAVMFRYGCR